MRRKGRQYFLDRAFGIAVNSRGYSVRVKSEKYEEALTHLNPEAAERLRGGHGGGGLVAQVCTSAIQNHTDVAVFLLNKEDTNGLLDLKVGAQ